MSIFKRKKRVEEEFDELYYLKLIDESVIKAGQILELQDFDDDDWSDDRDARYEDIYHCGTCTVRVVLETVWPSIEAYIDYMKRVDND
jgi:hypothetical protein